jgi:signal transduction histidine kinase
MLKTDTIEAKGTFRKFLNVLTQIAWTVNPTGEVVFYNQKWYNYTGKQTVTCNDPMQSLHIASLLPQEEMHHYFSPALETDYYKIEFKDNGIVFKQEYADRIFNIFQRLHGKTEFAGTGIVAMCQKIVQNHHGKISAKGKPGSSSTFIILLPSKQK